MQNIYEIDITVVVFKWQPSEAGCAGWAAVQATNYGSAWSKFSEIGQSDEEFSLIGSGVKSK